jgi:hypothetical protein
LAHHGIVDLRGNPIEVSVNKDALSQSDNLDQKSFARSDRPQARIQFESSAKGAEYNSQGQARVKRARRPWITLGKGIEPRRGDIIAAVLRPFRVCRKNRLELIVQKIFARICLVTSFSMATNDFSFPVFSEI